MTGIGKSVCEVESQQPVLKSRQPGFWGFPRWRTGKDTKRVHTTGRYPVVQFSCSKKPFMAFGKVPFADNDFLEMPARYLPLNCKSDGHRIDGGVP
jgi:hypothetical protein